MATSLDKLENKLQFYHLHVNAFIWCKDCENRSSIDPEIFDQIGQFFGRVVPDVHKLSSVNLGVTEANFTKFSHDIQASFALLMRTLR